jgi:uncharacterized membrane protein YvbJ
MQCTNCGADLQPGATVCPSCEQRVTPTKRAAEVHERKPWQSPIIVAITVIFVALLGWAVWTVVNTNTNTPEAAATRMMAAYGAYDAGAILDNVTHSSLTAGDLTAFQKQVVDGKASNKGRPWVKDVKITKSTIDPKDPTSATVQLTEQILDPAKGTYSVRNETLSLVKQSGKWLVRLF